MGDITVLIDRYGAGSSILLGASGVLQTREYVSLILEKITNNI